MIQDTSYLVLSLAYTLTQKEMVYSVSEVPHGNTLSKFKEIVHTNKNQNLIGKLEFQFCLSNSKLRADTGNE